MIKPIKMRKSILALAAFALMAGAMSTSCNSSSQKVDDAQNSVKEARQDLDAANKEYLAEIENFRVEMAARIDANDKRIAELKANLVHEKKEARADYKKRIDALEQKNRDLKKEMDEYKATGRENWEIFKTEFNHDMDQLGQAFKDIGVRNTK